VAFPVLAAVESFDKKRINRLSRPRINRWHTINPFFQKIYEMEAKKR
jgi:hypothetical protein